MKDIPGLFFILILVFVAGGGLFAYSRMGPAPVPNAESAWEYVEAFRQNLEYRRVNLAVGATRESNLPPYHFTAQRLSDVDQPTLVARYILKIRLLEGAGRINPWLQDGLDVGLIDLKPGNILGSVRLVASRKLGEKNPSRF
jgi:hypothetical protein